MKRKNNNEEYAWYLTQEQVDFIESLRESNATQEAASGSCRRRLGVSHYLLRDSDSFIRGVKSVNIGIPYPY